MERKRYTLHAFVCGRDCVHMSEHIGAMTADQILVDRPPDCRYAVVSDGDRVLVWDMYRAVPAGYDVLEPQPIRELTDVDAAIVATALLYDDPE